MAQMKQLPLAPLEVLARTAHEGGSGPSREWSDTVFAELVGVSARTIARWRAANNSLTWIVADEVATRFGLHPLEVWGGDWLALDAGVLDGTDRRAIAGIETALDRIGEVLDAESETAAA